MKIIPALALLLFVPTAHSAIIATTTTINFDTTADGTPLIASGFYDETSPLTDLYSTLGVQFSGLIPGQGGAILDVSSNFGVDAFSGSNFLAFNRFYDLSYPSDPEIITFDLLMSDVSIQVASSETRTLTLVAYDADDVVVATDSVTVSGNWAQLSTSYATGIKYVVLQSTDEGSDVYFVADDLTFTTVPEPSAALLAAAAAGLACVRRRRL